MIVYKVPHYDQSFVIEHINIKAESNFDTSIGMVFIDNISRPIWPYGDNFQHQSVEHLVVPRINDSSPILVLSTR